MALIEFGTKKAEEEAKGTAPWFVPSFASVFGRMSMLTKAQQTAAYAKEAAKQKEIARVSELIHKGNPVSDATVEGPARDSLEMVLRMSRAEDLVRSLGQTVSKKRLKELIDHVMGQPSGKLPPLSGGK